MYTHYLNQIKNVYIMDVLQSVNIMMLLQKNLDPLCQELINSSTSYYDYYSVEFPDKFSDMFDSNDNYGCALYSTSNL